MSKTLNDVRLIVTIRDTPGRSVAVKFGSATCMVPMIRRHVDYVDDVVIEKEYACEYCGSPWTGDSDKYNSGCCKEDEDRRIQ